MAVAVVEFTAALGLAGTVKMCHTEMSNIMNGILNTLELHILTQFFMVTLQSLGITQVL